MTALDAATLGSLPAGVGVPTYDRSVCKVGMVHFGVGAFHRSHQAMFADRLLALGEADWAICGVGVMEADRAMRDVMRAQDNLYTLVTVGTDGTSEARVIGSLVEYLYAPDEPEKVLDRLVAPTTHIVSLTVTEGGYGVSDVTGEFEPQGALTLADLATDGPPRSVLGFIVAALQARRANGTPPFTVMSCDNLAHNGDVARTAVLGFARQKSPELAEWVARNVSFPSSMVDRITPVTTDETRAAVRDLLGVDDGWPVRSEAFCQWVLEDRFVDGRPPFERVGVQVVEDVGPYEMMKLRLLNASHQAMSYLGILAGGTWVHETCPDALFVRFLLGYMHEEAVPTLEPVPGVDLDGYCDELIARFASEATRDTLARQVVDGSDRVAKFLLPVLRHQLARDGDRRRTVLVLAAWSTFLEERAALGGPEAVEDRRRAQLAEAVAAERERPGGFLGLGAVFGDLGRDDRLRDEFVAARAALAERGPRGAMAAIAGPEGRVAPR
jgi:mannitol 2-dehydrogenase